MNPFDDVVFVYYSYDLCGIVEVPNERVAQTLADVNHRYIVFESTIQEMIDHYGISHQEGNTHGDVLG